MIQNQKVSIKKISRKNLEVFFCKKVDFTKLEVSLFENELLLLEKITNPFRKNEFIGVRFLRNLINKDLQIYYSDFGKPYTIIPNQYISISHSKNYIGFAVSSHPIGLDIEECNSRIFKVMHKFLNEREKELIDIDSIEQVTSTWCVKECLFKLNNRNGINFQEELIIESYNKNAVIAKMLGTEKWEIVNLAIEKFEDLIICFNFE